MLLLVSRAPAMMLQFLAQCENGLFGNCWLIRDSSYPCKTYLLTPLLNPVIKSEQNYNKAYIRTRNTIERRFPVMSLTIRLSLSNTQAVIIATAVLHNICRQMNIVDVRPEIEIPFYDIAPTERNEDEEGSGYYREKRPNQYLLWQIGVGYVIT